MDWEHGDACGTGQPLGGSAPFRRLLLMRAALRLRAESDATEAARVPWFNA